MLVVIQIVVLIAGFVALVKGADLFVDGSSALARRFHVPSLIIGLTIVALGTSLPELAVSTSAAMAGSNEIAISNVVGSNLFNTLVVLGCCAVVCTVPVDRKVVRRDMPIVFISTIIVLASVAAGVIRNGLRATAHRDTAHKQLGLRPGSVHIDRSDLALPAWPRPVRDNMKRRAVRVPNASVKPISVLRDRG